MILARSEEGRRSSNPRAREVYRRFAEAFRRRTLLRSVAKPHRQTQTALAPARPQSCHHFLRMPMNPIIGRELLEVLRTRKALALQLGLAVACALLVLVRWPTGALADLSGDRSLQDVSCSVNSVLFADGTSWTNQTASGGIYGL